MSDDTFKTCGTFAGYFYEFKGEDEYCLSPVVVEIAEVRDNGEIEIAFSVDNYRHYLDFRLKDLLRAVKETPA